jgi:hypothetical protein
MTHPDISQLIAMDYHHRLAADASRRRLIAIATCCRPSRLIAAARALRFRLSAGGRPAACCA